MEYRNKEVRFDLYCDTCKHFNRDESNDICEECVESPVNEHSRKPIKYEEQTDKRKISRRKK